MSTESMGNVHGLSGQFPWTQWTLSMDIVQSNRSNITAGQCPWKMSIKTIDILQTGFFLISEKYSSDWIDTMAIENAIHGKNRITIKTIV